MLSTFYCGSASRYPAQLILQHINKATLCVFICLYHLLFHGNEDDNSGCTTAPRAISLPSVLYNTPISLRNDNTQNLHESTVERQQRQRLLPQDQCAMCWQHTVILAKRPIFLPIFLAIIGLLVVTSRDVVWLNSKIWLKDDVRKAWRNRAKNRIMGLQIFR